MCQYGVSHWLFLVHLYSFIIVILLYSFRSRLRLSHCLTPLALPARSVLGVVIGHTFCQKLRKADVSAIVVQKV